MFLNRGDSDKAPTSDCPNGRTQLGQLLGITRRTTARNDRRIGRSVSPIEDHHVPRSAEVQ